MFSQETKEAQSASTSFFSLSDIPDDSGVFFAQRRVEQLEKDSLVPTAVADTRRHDNFCGLCVYT